VYHFADKSLLLTTLLRHAGASELFFWSRSLCVTDTYAYKSAHLVIVSCWGWCRCSQRLL